MKIIARYIKSLYNAQGIAEATFQVSNFSHIAMLNELDTAKEYRIQIDEVKSLRSIEQNRLLWAMLNELEHKTQVDSWTWYIQALEETNASYEYIWGMESTEDTLKQVFRAVKRIKPHTIKESNGWLYKCYLGSSKFNTTEMTALIEVVLRFCEEMDIDTDRRLYD